MAEILDTIVADTSFEAEEKARKKYGNNFEIINSKNVVQKSHFGFLAKQLVQITIRVNDHFPNNSLANNEPYIIPAPPISPETFSPVTDNSMAVEEQKTVYRAGFGNISNSNRKRPTYSKSQIDRTNVDSLRGIQEGDDIPRGTKQQTLNSQYSDSTSDFLNAINDLKRIRQTEAHSESQIKLNNIATKKIDELQKQMENLQSIVRDFVESSSSFLAANQLPPGLSYLEKELHELEIPQETIKDLFKSLQLDCSKDTLGESKATFNALHALLKKRLSICPQFELKKSSRPQVIVLMGPTGVGKTTTIAKLAARFCLNPLKRIKACFFNIDFYKLGAKDQLLAYASIFEIPVEDITSIDNLNSCLEKHKNDDLIIVDTAGRSQYAEKDLEELRSYLIRIPNATKYLALSSTSKYSDLKEIVRCFGRVGYDHLILTKTDETKTIGPAVGLLLKSKKSLAYITHGQQVPEDYQPANFKFFEDRLFNSRENNDDLGQQLIY